MKLSTRLMQTIPRVRRAAQAAVPGRLVRGARTLAEAGQTLADWPYMTTLEHRLNRPMKTGKIATPAELLAEAVYEAAAELNIPVLTRIEDEHSIWWTHATLRRMYSKAEEDFLERLFDVAEAQAHSRWLSQQAKLEAWGPTAAGQEMSEADYQELELELQEVQRRVDALH